MKSDCLISVVLPVLAPSPFLRSMTEFCIQTLRLHADRPFELIVVEAEDNYFSPDRPLWAPDAGGAYPRSEMAERGQFVGCPDKYLNFTPKIGGVREINEGIRAASGQFIVTAGNDVIVPPHWDTELLRCFEERKDCGLAAPSAFEPGAVIGSPQYVDRLVEGMYSPFNMFRKGWTYDESYLRVYQDSDLVMRIYEAGLRAYRTCRCHVHHLLRMTNDRVDTERHNELLARDEKLFYTRWGNSPLSAFAMIRYGHYTYGREYESFLAPINLHYDPSKP